MSDRRLVILGTSSQQPTRKRNHGAYLALFQNEGLLFDPGEGTQRQFIYANVRPPSVTRIFISHFHGDHCLGLGSMLMRLNLDKVSHPIHCYYPASGKVHFDRLRFGTIYHNRIHVIEHPVSADGIVHQDDRLTIEAAFLQHGVDNVGWRITERSTRKFYPNKLQEYQISGPLIKKIESQGYLPRNFLPNPSVLHHQQEHLTLEEVSWIRPGKVLAVVIDTLPCQAAIYLAQNATLLLCESTYLETEAKLAREHLHMTAKQAAELARDANAEELILTHFSARYNRTSLFAKEATPYFPNVHAAHDLDNYPIPL
ncbi:MAG: ribonuclease Z [Chlamydiota bacterium]|nr:ribonuclease Z [Chlamydiota bacterium]